MRWKSPGYGGAAAWSRAITIRDPTSASPVWALPRQCSLARKRGGSSERSWSAMTGTVDGSTTWLAHRTGKSGVGHEMVVSAEGWLRACGVVKVQLMVRETNAQVIEFYERLGFEVIPRIAMAKWLNQ